MRLVPTDARRFPPGATGPSLFAFELSSGDREQSPPRLSVFDTELTTVDQARAIHGRADTLPFVLPVDGVRRLAAGGAFLEVRYDPLPPPQCEMPGAKGHAGILGMDLGSKIERKNVRAALAALCAPAEDP